MKSGWQILRAHMCKPGKSLFSFQGYARSLSGPLETGVWLAAQIQLQLFAGQQKPTGPTDVLVGAWGFHNSELVGMFR